MIINTITVSNCQPQTIVIGRRGTYDTMQIAFDLSYLVESYGNGVAVLAVKRSQDTSAYPAVTSQEDDLLLWTVSETDTHYVGAGECQLMWYVDGGLAKTIIYPMVVMRDILATSEDAPDAYQTWVDDLTALGAETLQNAQNAEQSASDAETAKDDAVTAKEGAEAAQQAAETAVTHYPKIENNYWMVWDSTSQSYVSTGIQAEGEDGYSPEITITSITGGHRVIITDKDHPQGQSFDVLDGQGGGGSSDYATLSNKPKINNVELDGNKTAHDLGLAAQTDIPTVPVQSVNGKTGAVNLASGDIGYDETATYQAGSVGAELQEQNRQLNDVDSAFNSVAEYVTPVNLYNKNSPLNIDNYRLQAGSASTSASGSSISHPIKVEAGKTYTFKYSASYYGVVANRIVKFCDKDGNIVYEWASISATDNGTASGTFTVTAEQIAQISEYVCVNVRMIDKGVMIFVEGDTLPGYSEWFEPYWMIRESALPDNMPLPANAQNNLLYGKKAAFTGDSICYGQGAAGGYAAIIGSDNNMTISNTGQTGATLATGTTVDGGNRGWISQKVGNMPDGYDYYIVEGGINDAAGDVNVPLGTLSSGYTETLDTTTLYGAMEQICKTLQTTFLGKKYGFLIPHNCYGMSHRWNTQFRPAMKECLEKWGIPYLDLSDKCVQLNNLSALRIYTLNGDGWHPTEEGYRLFYVPKIEAWMKTL